MDINVGVGGIPLANFIIGLCFVYAAGFIAGMHFARRMP